MWEDKTIQVNLSLFLYWNSKVVLDMYWFRGNKILKSTLMFYCDETFYLDKR